MNISDSDLLELEQAAANQFPVKGLTHTFYRYPARFSPIFIRKVIETFTDVGDLVIDPFVGGGTSAVEARTLGRRFLGIDINTLAIFVSQVKTTALTRSDIKEIINWKSKLPKYINLKLKPQWDKDWLNYQKNLDKQGVWRIKKVINLALGSFESLTPKQERFARCVILKTSQWALDSKKDIPSLSDFRNKLFFNIDEMLELIIEYSSVIRRADSTWGANKLPRTTFLNRSVIGVEDDKKIRSFSAPRLIVTSPPYPGVHILYHRWQVKGRRETPAPYWIANRLDGAGASYYTFGDRKENGLSRYFQNVYQSFSSLSKLSDENTVVVQMLAFNDPCWQLPYYLEMMEKSGFTETQYSSDSNFKERIWRDVPNRKWFASQKGNINSSREVVLIHKRKD